jgi:hypothetical protein
MTGSLILKIGATSVARRRNAEPVVTSTTAPFACPVRVKREEPNPLRQPSFIDGRAGRYMNFFVTTKQ